MSYSFRERLKIALREDLKEKLGLSQKDVEFMWDNIGSICPISDELLDALRKHDPQFEGKDIDQIVDMLTKQEFADLVAEVLEHGFKKLAYKKQKDKKKVEEEPEKEVEEESETDSDADSDADATEEEAELECESK